LPSNYTHDSFDILDGQVHEVVLINNQLPGPPIQVYKDAQVIVNLVNRFRETISIHWHGLDQFGSGVIAPELMPIVRRPPGSRLAPS